MSKRQFRADMRRGLGSCHLALDQCDDIEEYRQDVLWGCIHAIAYDTQSEGSRAIYLFEMIERFEDWSEFHALLADCAKRTVKDFGWQFSHCSGILVLMAADGYVPARQTLEELNEMLLRALWRGRPKNNGFWPAQDNYCGFCIEMLTNGLSTKKEKEAFFLRVLAEYGRLIRKRPLLRDRFEEMQFELVAQDLFGRRRMNTLLQKGRSDPDIRLYLENRDRMEEEWKAYQQESNNAVLERQTESATEEPMDAVDSALANYQPGDGTRVISLVKSVSLDEDDGNWHHVFMTVIQLIDENRDADRELSAALLPFMYRKGFCSWCRCEIVEQMIKRGLLTPAMIEECRHDCNLDIRKLVDNI